ncbi:hypothetical protein [Oleomonas cavernae]|nr:hypothetical protein [Oleomonas cavernae]
MTDDPPLMRGDAAAARHPGALGGVEPLTPRPPRRRRGPDWGLLIITIAFLGGAGGLFYFGYMRHDTGLLGEGESRTIAARPDTVIPDGGPAPAATAGGGTAPAPAAGGGYDMSVPAQGGDVSTRPGARTAPEPGGGSKPRPTSTAPGVLIAPPGVKPVK